MQAADDSFTDGHAKDHTKGATTEDAGKPHRLGPAARAGSPSPRPTRSCLTEARVLLQRSALTVARDPSLLLAHLSVAALTGLLLGQARFFSLTVKFVLQTGVNISVQEPDCCHPQTPSLARPLHKADVFGPMSESIGVIE